MEVFQICSFVLEIVFWLGIALFVALNPSLFIKKKDDEFNEIRGHGNLEIIGYDNRRIKFPRITLSRLAWFLAIMAIYVFFMLPNLQDIPQLVTGKLNYVTGMVFETKTKNKDPMEYVYLDTGDEVRFFFASDVKKFQEYKIGYLNHSLRAIYCAEVDYTGNVTKRLVFPIKDILFFILIMGIMIFIVFVSQFIKFKIFIPSSIISIIGLLYFFISDGTKNKIWFSALNKGFPSLMICIAGILITLMLRFGEKKKDGELFWTYFFAQVFSISSIMMLIGIIFNFDM